MSNILEVKNLVAKFYLEDSVVHVLNDVSFSIEKGKVVSIIGESGSGKTVSCLSVMRLLPKPQGKIINGEILFEGKDLLKLNNKEMTKIRGSRISMIFQDPMTSLNPFLTVGFQLEEVLKIHLGLNRSDSKNRVLKMLDVLGISNPSERINSYPHQLSGGMRQRIMIASALLCEPDLLIADEPVTALDVTIQAQILELINNIKREFSTSIIFISHDLGVVAGITDVIYIMYAGRIVEKGTVDEIYFSPKHPYTKALLCLTPRLDKYIDKILPIIKGQPPDLTIEETGCPFYNRCPDSRDICTKSFPLVTTFSSTQEVYCHEYPPSINK